ncbi:MAG: 23S rRNA (adenine(2503)-C(2))-methyltransferase RlmN [Planctomycetota bacterium]
MANLSTHFFHETPDSLAQWCADRRQPAFRAKQIFEWVYRKGVIDPLAMTNLPGGLREALAAEMSFLTGETIAHQRASDGTQKLLIAWDREGKDEETSRSLPIAGQPVATGWETECVMIPSLDDTERGYPKRRTACISSQVGCPVGCRFCASGLEGLDGNLSAGRIVEQVWRLDRILMEQWEDQPDAPDRGITNIVFMGMGEPLANFGNVVQAVRTLVADWGMNIGARKITISTVGMHKAIERLADDLDLPVTLALSLHAPNDNLRRELIPWAEFTTIEQLFAACARWFEKTGREITLEYTLLDDVNDRPEHAQELAVVAKRLRANVNLIRFNEVDAVPFGRPKDQRVRAFQTALADRGVNVHIRASRGRDIAAACGQLRHEQAAS